MTRIEAPPGDTSTVVADACRILTNVQGKPGAVALMDRDRFELWRAAVRTHRAAWQHHLDRVTAEAVRTYEQQGAAAGWLHR